MGHFIAMQVKEKEISYKRLREENEFAQKVHIHPYVPQNLAVVQQHIFFLLLA
jgi:hypothetical protein